MIAVCVETLGRHPMELDWLPYKDMLKLAAYMIAKNERESKKF